MLKTTTPLVVEVLLDFVFAYFMVFAVASLINKMAGPVEVLVMVKSCVVVVFEPSMVTYLAPFN